MSKPKIGLVGGLGPLSTVDYYIGIMDRIHNDFGMDNYPEIVIDSLSLNREGYKKGKFTDAAQG